LVKIRPVTDISDIEFLVLGVGGGGWWVVVVVVVGGVKSFSCKTQTMVRLG